MRRRQRSGRWFTAMVAGLLADDTVLADRFRPAPESKPEERT